MCCLQMLSVYSFVIFSSYFIKYYIFGLLQMAGLWFHSLFSHTVCLGSVFIDWCTCAVDDKILMWFMWIRVSCCRNLPLTLLSSFSFNPPPVCCETLSVSLFLAYKSLFHANRKWMTILPCHCNGSSIADW